MKTHFTLLLSSWAAFAAASAQFPSPFYFGVANAPGQVEDQLPDIWMEWADKGKIKAFKGAPKEKLSFWTKPETEIDLAAGLGVQAYRMGVDWGRIMPAPHTFDEKVIERYREIIKQVRSKNMRIMMTLMHHSIPKWAQDLGGWKSEKMPAHFVEFGKRVIHEYKDDVEWWATFNEGNVFVTMAYTVGIWPPGETASPLSLAAIGPFVGDSIQAMDRMADAHNELYKWAHGQYLDIKVGLAHNMAYYTGKSWWNRFKAGFGDAAMNWRFPERVKDSMDYFGFNYYGAEWLKGSQVDVDPEEEYSEAGRAIYPEGLYWLLENIHKRFPKLPIIITENGIGDSTDILRPSYLIEHLMVVAEARKNGIPVEGYYVWSTTDNLEWSDGYCPKFGLVAVDRENGLKRMPRPSYELFKEIIRAGEVTAKQRSDAWNLVVQNQGKDRPFCRADDGVTAFDEPQPRKFVKKDWRFSPEKIIKD